MVQLVIQVHSQGKQEVCAVCGRRSYMAEGPQLYVAGRPAPACRDCGKKHAPVLAALLDLAATARRVGRIGRHTLFPPLTALLDLARAAEDYLHTSPHRSRPAV
jgi:hypothetical protein